MQLMSSDEMI